MNQTIKILSALAEPTRFEAIRLLWDGQEHCVCELMEVLDKGQSTMSRHMTSLKKAGLVVDRRDAQWVRYRRNPSLSKQLIALVEAALNLERPSKEEISMKCQCQSEAVETTPPVKKSPSALWIVGTLVGIFLWFVIYSQLAPFSKWIVSLLPVEKGTPLAEAVTFFFYDTPKVLMLLTLVVFVMGIIRSFFSPERTRALLAGKNEGLGNIAAACLGIVTPFCSCSAVPLFIGFVSAGVSLGVTLSFLISAPMVNEVALGLLFGLVGWKVAVAYLAFGLGVAIVAGWTIGRLHLEGWLEDWVRNARAGAATLPSEKLTVPDRIKEGLGAVREIVGKVWPWMIAGIAAGAFIHGYAPAELLVSIMGKDAWWSVPAAVAVGVPMYSNAAGIIPVVEALLGKGAALGTVLAFMMSVIALSLPEMIILRKVLTLKLLAVFVGVVASGILAVGYLFNALFV